MKIVLSNRQFNSCRGSAIVVVILLCTALMVASAVFFNALTVNRRMNQKSLLLAEARQGAEGLLAFASAELNRRAISYSSLSSSTPLSGYTLSTTDQAFFAGSGTSSNLVLSSLTIVPGPLSLNKTTMTLPSEDPEYSGDPDAGKLLDVRSGDIFAKATTQDPITGVQTTSYLAGTVQVREQTWLNYGIFFNMDMEFHPGVNMDIMGAVHTNGNLYLAADGTATVSFYKKLTAAGKIYRGIKYDLTNTTMMPGYVSCIDSSNAIAANLMSMAYGQDCRNASWVTLEKNRWNSYVMDSSLSVPTFSPPQLPLYVPEDYSTTATELRNHGYGMIEPQLPSPDSSDGRYYGQKTTDEENIKLSALAGLTIVVDELTDAQLQLDATSGYAIPWKLVWYKGSVNASLPINKNNLPVRDATTGLPVVLGTIDPFILSDDDKTVGTATATIQRNLKAALRDAIIVVPYKDSGGTPYGTGTAAVSITSYSPASYAYVASGGSATTRYNQPAASYPAWYNDSATTNYYGTFTSAQTAKTKFYGSDKYSGMYDRRQGFNGTTGVSYSTDGSSTPDYNYGLSGAMVAVYIDLGKLDWVLNQSSLWLNPSTGAAIYDPSVSYTGAIYVDLPSAAKDTTNTARWNTTDGDFICHAARATTTKPGYCVILKDCMRLPRFTSNLNLRDDGFTIATNAPLYIWGNYNSDSDSTTGNSYLPDSDASTATTSNPAGWYSTANPNAEVPAMVAADAVSILTQGFAPWNSNKARYAGNTSSTSDSNVASVSSNFLEISTAIITGQTATIPLAYAGTYGAYRWMGGVQNFPRFLEDLGSVTVRYRGTMAGLFVNEVATANFIQGSHSYWFAPPTRDWGYHAYFAAGKYPPGTPVIRTARLINVRDISVTEYTAGPQQQP